jgi:hypothetical protein
MGLMVVIVFERMEHVSGCGEFEKLENQISQEQLGAGGV